MGVPAWLAPGFQRELDLLDERPRKRVLEVLRSLGQVPVPLESPRVRVVQGCSVPNMSRVRIGPYRVLGALLPNEHMILYTTLFRKKRASDYSRALQRHVVRAQEAGR